MSETSTRTCAMQFKVSATSGKARRGELSFPRGKVQTPAFMPVGTYGTVKGMLLAILKKLALRLFWATHSI